ncbi:MAG: DUF4214 domain-containing protein [Acidimicrobiales bacterium]
MKTRRLVLGVAVLAPVALAGWFAVAPVPPAGEPPATTDGPAAVPVRPPPARLPLAEPGVEGSVARLLMAASGRDAAGPELDHWVSRYRDGDALPSIAEAVAGSTAFARTYGDSTDPVFVERLYRNVMRRRPAPTEVEGWAAALTRGHDRAFVLVAFSESEEFVSRSGTPPPAPPRPLLARAGVEHSVARLHLGLFGRWPERAELDDGVRRYLDGTPLATIAASLLERPDVAPRFAGMGGEAFVAQLYSDVLGRVATAAELGPWRARLDGGDSRGSVLTAFTESNEMVTRTRTAAPAPAPVRHVLYAVGDSVMAGAVSAMASIPRWTVHVDARECRQLTTRTDGCRTTDIPSGVDALRSGRENGFLGGVVAMQLGNNGPISDQQFDALMAEVADQRLVLFITIKEPRPWEATNNAVLAAGVARWPNARLVDWKAAGGAHPDWFSDGEGIHLSGAGAQGMADLIASALPE